MLGETFIFSQSVLNMYWLIFVLLLSLCTVLPLGWAGCNRILCARVPTLSCFRHLRLFLRVWVSMFFASLWLSVQPNQSVTSTPLEWQWQLPLFAAIPIVMTFGEFRKPISCCLLTMRLMIATMGCLSSLAIVTIVWALKSSKTAQGVALCTLQPTFSASIVTVQNNIRPSRRSYLEYSHLLEVMITFQSFVYGANASDEFTAWKLPVYAFASFGVGIVVILICVLFIAPDWRCGVHEATTEGADGDEDECGDDKASRADSPSIPQPDTTVIDVAAATAI